MRYRETVDTAPSQLDELNASVHQPNREASTDREFSGWDLSPQLLDQLCAEAGVKSCEMSPDEFAGGLLSVGAKVNFGLTAGVPAATAQKIAFFRGLRLPELALAHACALGREAAWARFIGEFRGPLTQAAVAITGSATVGHELADSLYSELYGLKESQGQRQSPLRSYTGRGSLMGWLRTTLAQRFVDHHRRTHRETTLENVEEPASNPLAAAPSPMLPVLTVAIRRAFERLGEEDRFLLVSYYLDRRTLHQIGAVLQVHEATISRRMQRVLAEVRKQLLRNLERAGLSRRAAEEALGADPRDIELNLRELVQSCQNETFTERSEASNRP
jgi:RNA polymerase sigma-70 factor (ECF subfamily)